MSYIGNQVTTTAFLTDQFSGNGSTVAFTMSAAPATTSSIIVAVTGVLQDPSTYAVSGTTLTFSAAPPTGTGNISVRYLGIPASGVATTAYRTVTEFTATSGQTTFNVPSYTVGYIDVYRNGVRLGAADFTATTGTTVVLASAASLGDLVTTESFYVSSVLNAIPATTGAVNTGYIANGAVTQAKLNGGIAGTGPAFIASASSTQTVSVNTNTKLAFNFEQYDSNNCFDASNYRFTPNVAGYYQVSITSYLQSTVNTQAAVSIVFKNGAGTGLTAVSVASSYSYPYASVSGLLYCNGTTDYLEAYGQATGASGTLVISGVSFNAALVRAA